MSSLTTVYFIGILLASIAGMGSAFASNMLKSKEPEKEPEKEPPLAIQDKSLNEEHLNFGKGITEFIQTPVEDWRLIANSPGELRKKYRDTMTHTDQGKCPTRLLELCKLVSIKYSNMRNFIEGNEYSPLGDQTQEAVAILSDNQ
jgi:hypothetical protein